MDEKYKKLFVGKKIKDIDADGYEVVLTLENGTQLIYDATDGGFSTYRIINEKEMLED